jgi:hypothetical protein
MRRSVTTTVRFQSSGRTNQSQSVRRRSHYVEVAGQQLLDVPQQLPVIIGQQQPRPRCRHANPPDLPWCFVPAHSSAENGVA